MESGSLARRVTAAKTLVPSSATTSPSRFRPDIQGLRGIAVLLVVLYHAGTFVEGGFIGVDVFFVISGFVIGASLMSEHRRTGSISLQHFFGRRVRRILPALSTMLVVTLLGSLFLLSPLGPAQAAGDTARAAAISLANFQLYGAVDYFGPASELNPLLHTWSLSVEEQFYLGFAVLTAIGVPLLAGRRRALIAVLSAVAFGSFVVSLIWSSGWVIPFVDDPMRLAFFSPFARAFEFLVGVLLAVLMVGGRELRGRWLPGFLAVCGLAAIGVASLRIDAETSFPGLAVLVPVVGAALVIAGAGQSASVTSMLSVAPLRRVGDLSYSWYLWHWPIIVWAKTLWPGASMAVAAAVAVSFGVAVLSYRFVEQPFRSASHWRGVATVSLAAACVALPLVAAMGFLRLVDTGLGLEAAADFNGRTEAREIGCHGDLDAPILPIGQCTWAVEDSRGIILLVGDSHAVSIADSVVRVGNDLNYDVAVQTRSLCPFQTRRVKRRGCANYQRETIALINELRPAAVIIANRSPIYTLWEPDTSRSAVVDENDDVTTTPMEALIAWEDGLDDALDQFGGATDRVIIVETVPEFENAGASASISLVRPTGNSEHRSLEKVRDRRMPTLRIHARLSSTNPVVEVLDPVPVLCEEDCSQRRGGRWLFYDDDHLTTYGATLLEPLLAERLAGL